MAPEDFLIHNTGDKSFLQSMPIHPVVAVDGTAASGKSTFSRALADRLGFFYVSTGEMYRGVTWVVREAGIDPRDGQAVEKWIAATPVETSLRNGELAFTVRRHRSAAACARCVGERRRLVRG